MSSRQPGDLDTPRLSTEVHELLSQLKTFNRPEDIPARIHLLERVLTLVSRTNHPTLWAELHVELGDALQRNRMGDRQVQLSRSIDCYDTALTVYTRESTLEDWARTQSNKGCALRKLALVSAHAEQVNILCEAINCHESVLLKSSREGAPHIWAAAQNNLAIALNDLATLLGWPERKEMLQKAMKCYKQALLEYHRDTSPNDWAMIQYNLSTILRDLAIGEKSAANMEMLQNAVVYCDNTLPIYTREARPVEWAMIQRHKGVVLQDLAGMLFGTERAKALRDALACYNNALLELRHDIDPLSWAMTLHNKGALLHDIAVVLMGKERVETLNEAIVCYDAALDEHRRRVVPLRWAATQLNRGIALHELARLSDDTTKKQKLGEAIACYENALLEYHYETRAADWMTAMRNKGAALNDFAELLEGVTRVEKLRGAIECYDKVLQEQQREAVPVGWAITQHSKGIALYKLAHELAGDEHTRALQEVMKCYDAALSVFTRQALPADHLRIAQSIGMLLFKEGEWKNAARYLATALDALDDLFILEITIHGRKAVLKAGGDLAAHLAYALLRTGEADAVWRAAEALERGRARATGEAMARQKAQLAAASLLAPELLERFREASDRLVQISLGTETLEVAQTALSSDKMSVVGEAAEHTALTMLNMQLTEYEEARAARQAYDGIVSQIRSILPEFLKRDEVLEIVVQTLAPDERLGYIAHTLVGAMAILLSRADKGGGAPHLNWWDEQLTSAEVARLLTGPPAEGAEQPGEYVGLLRARSHSKVLRGALRVVMQTLGKPGGVVAHLAAHCQAARIQRLVLVPCGLLGLLPLHAALVPPAVAGDEPEPLLDVVRVSYTPSARIWAGCRRRAKEYSVQIPTALLVSDPQPQDPEVRPLSSAQVEAGAINEIISNKASGQVFAYNGREATLPVILDTLRTRAATLTHVHFACHGLVELSDPYTAGLLLAYGSRLMTRDLLDPAVVRFGSLRLAVLSACRTALPGTELPDEVVGLPLGWLQAGGIGVLASLWPISDSKTVALMTKFYELHLLDELDPVEALWLAQRWFRQLPTWRQDCQMVGALRAAEGPEVSEVVHELEVARGKTMLRDTMKDTSVSEIAGETTSGTMDMATDDIGEGNNTDQAPISLDQQKFWEYARHWAAFVVTGC